MTMALGQMMSGLHASRDASCARAVKILKFVSEKTNTRPSDIIAELLISFYEHDVETFPTQESPVVIQEHPKIPEKKISSGFNRMTGVPKTCDVCSSTLIKGRTRWMDKNGQWIRLGVNVSSSLYLKVIEKREQGQAFHVCQKCFDARQPHNDSPTPSSAPKTENRAELFIRYKEKVAELESLRKIESDPGSVFKDAYL